MAFRSIGTATSSPNTTTTSLTAGTPAGFVAGDILLMFVSLDATGKTITWSGGTQLFNDALTTDGQQVAVFWKRATGGDSLTVTLDVSPAASWVVQCAAWSGRHASNSPVGSTSATNNSANASPTTLTSNGVTAVLGDDLCWVGMLDANQGTTSSTFTQPTGYTAQATTIDTLDNFDVFGVASNDNVSAGATGTVSGTLTHAGGSGWAAYLIRIPAAPSGITVGEIMAATQFGQINPVIEKTEVVPY